jgi:RNA polymerase sigma-70 factor (ECF subfamily)
MPELSSGSTSNPESRLADKQQKAQIAEALQKLPIEQREAVVLRYYQDLAFDDIAAVCDVPLSTAKMRVYRGIQKLAQIWDNKPV